MGVEMNHKFLAVFFSLAPTLAWAVSSTADYSVAMGARSFPFGGAVIGEVGYGKIIWDRTQEPNAPQFLFSFIRPSLRVSTSGIVQRFEPKIEFYPIAPLGISVGYLGQMRLADTGVGYACTTEVCRGYVGTPYMKMRAIFGAGPWFALGSLRVGFVTAAAAGPFVDEITNLRAEAGGDWLGSANITTGVRLGERWIVGADLSWEQMRTAASSNDAQTLFAKFSLGRWSALAGTGAYRDTQNGRGFTAYALLQWTGISQVGLF